MARAVFTDFQNNSILTMSRLARTFPLRLRRFCSTHTLHMCIKPVTTEVVAIYETRDCIDEIVAVGEGPKFIDQFSIRPYFFYSKTKYCVTYLFMSMCSKVDVTS